MLHYALRRLLLIIPTLFGIMIVNFLIAQAAPGGPVDRMIARFQGTAAEATGRFAGEGGDIVRAGPRGGPAGEGGTASAYRGARGMDPALIKELEQMFGFDKPLPERFARMMLAYATFDLGRSYYRDTRVVDLIAQKLPVSISLGLWTTFLVYLVSIPLGIRKAVRHGSAFDVWTSAAIIIGYAIPAFLFAILLVVLFAGGRYWDWFPLRGLVSENWGDMPWPQRILDYLWHIALPVLALVIGGFASLCMLTKNAFLEEIHKQYVTTARAKGLSEKRVLWGHVFRNAMIVVIAGFPHAFLGVLFTGSVLIEVIFSLDGLGLLGFESAINRDYPVVFGTLYVFTLLGLAMNLLGDLACMLTDPRLDFESRGA